VFVPEEPVICSDMANVTTISVDLSMSALGCVSDVSALAVIERVGIIEHLH